MTQIGKKQLPLLFLTLTVLLLFLGLNVGSVPVRVRNIYELLLNLFNGTGLRELKSEPIYLILFNIRLPRMIMALLVGMMLSSSGVVVQAVFGNPLADPYLIGISASAVTGAVLAYWMGLPDLYYGFFAFFISLGVTFLIFRLSLREGRVNTTMLLIIGIALSSFMGAFTSFAMYSIGEDSYRITVWLMGYLGSATWNRVLLLLPPLVLAVAYFYYYRLDLDALVNGDETAHSLGINTGQLKKRLLVGASLIAAFSVAFTGMIGFVGLIIPHIIRLIFGNSHKYLIPFAAAGGGIFLLATDILARTLLAPVEIPIGVVTAFFGAPFFIFLALRAKGGRI
ncbi:MAG: iron ABC transporter permease [Spirochaetales bacterium]|nr:iron ABC transporter permease [Spirochaetales bacterium]